MDGKAVTRRVIQLYCEIIYYTELAKKLVLGCVIPPAGAVAQSRNLGQTFLANSVLTQACRDDLGHVSQHDDCDQGQHFLSLVRSNLQTAAKIIPD